MNQQNRPIGILDSGIGGFTVARQVRRMMPQENIVYLGDGGNNPYGNHSTQEILSLVRYMLEFMREKDVKILLLACNTSSCLIDQFRAEMPCPVLSVVHAGACAAKQSSFRRFGVISTVFTHIMGGYGKEISAVFPEATVYSRGCPNLAGMIERHVSDPSAIAELDAEIVRDLSDLVGRKNIECCILGCTHFPLVEENIARLFPHLPLIDPAYKMAQQAKEYLQQNHLARTSEGKGRLDIYTTSSVTEYREKAARFGLDDYTHVAHHPPLSLE